MLAAMSTSRLSAALALLVVSMPAAHALAWPTLDPEGPRTPLLGGRWTILLGPGVSTAPAVSDPRAPLPRASLDGVAAMHDEEGRLAVRATLLFATRPEDLEAVVRTLPAPCDAPSIATLPGHEGVIAITCTEPSPDGAFRPLVLYATHTDGWVDRIEVQLETDEASDPAAAMAFATAVASSLRAEDVAPDVERGVVEVTRACVAGEASDPFTVTLPEGWIATRQGGEELAVLQLMKATALGTPRPLASIALTPLGAPPARIPAGAGAPRAGSLLGTSVEWLEIVGPADAPGMREVAVAVHVECGGDAPPWGGTLQLSAGGPSSLLDEGTRVLESLAMAGDRGHVAVATPIGTEEEAIPELEPSASDAEDEAAAQTSHLWSMGIGAASLLLLLLALVLRGRTTRPK